MIQYTEDLHPRGPGGKWTSKNKQLPSPLRRRAATGAKPVAAHQPGFWGFKQPAKGKGPKPIHFQAPAESSDASPKNWQITSKEGPHGELRIANNVAALSTPADFDAPETVNPDLTPEQREQARVRAKAIFDDSVARAPAIQAAIRPVVTGNHGSMGREIDAHTGAPTAVKTEHSTWRKVQKKMVDNKVTSDQVHLSDSVRFTAVFDDDSYAEGVPKLRSAMEALGYTMKEPPPDINGGMGGWALGPYRGLNMTFEQNGFVFELQAHTPTSMHVADTYTHPLYDVTRSTDKQITKLMAETGPKGAKAKTGIEPDHLTPGEYRAQVDHKMHDIAETVPIPRGVAVIAGKDKWSDVVGVTPTTGHYSARTGAPIKPPSPMPGPRPGPVG